jgi:hypothetical protein
MKNKKFDCVEMKHRAAEKIAEKLKGLSRKAELSYWRASYNTMTTHSRKITSKLISPVR